MEKNERGIKKHYKPEYGKRSNDIKAAQNR